MLTTGAARTRQGVTLIELMVASAMMFVIVGYSMGTFTIQHQTYVVVDQVSEAQQNIRAIASLLERDARNAGYLVPTPGATCGIDCCTRVAATAACMPIPHTQHSRRRRAPPSDRRAGLYTLQ